MRSNIRLTTSGILAMLIILAACGGDDTDTVSPTATSEHPDPASSPPASPMAENPGFEVAETANEEPFTKPTPPGGVVPTAAPPMESSFDSDGDGFYTSDELKLALEARIGEYVWPEGYAFSVDKAHQNITRDIPDHAGFENVAE